MLAEKGCLHKDFWSHTWTLYKGPLGGLMVLPLCPLL